MKLEMTREQVQAAIKTILLADAGKVEADYDPRRGGADQVVYHRDGQWLTLCFMATPKNEDTTNAVVCALNTAYKSLRDWLVLESENAALRKAIEVKDVFIRGVLDAGITTDENGLDTNWTTDAQAALSTTPDATSTRREKK